MNMMIWGTLFTPPLFLRSMRPQLNPSETVPESTSGQDNNVQMENGSDLTKKYLLKNGHSISISCTSEPNITMIHMTLTPPSSTEASSSITNQDSSPPEKENGTSKVNV